MITNVMQHYQYSRWKLLIHIQQEADVIYGIPLINRHAFISLHFHPYQHSARDISGSVLLFYFLPETTTRKSNKMTKNTLEYLDDIAGTLQKLEEVFGDAPLEDEEENSQTQGPDSI